MRELKVKRWKPKGVKSKAKQSKIDQLRQQVRALARSGKHTRHEIGIILGIRYEIVCDLTKHINMHPQNNDARQSAANFGRMRWEISRGHTAEHEDRRLNYNGFHPTDAPTGSSEKIEVLRRRVEMKQPLWHPNDRADYNGIRVLLKARD
jgi:hypothetical protein